MPTVLRCPHCGKSLQVPEQATGKSVRCPHPGCNKVIKVADLEIPQTVGAAGTTRSVTLGASPKASAPAGKSDTHALGLDQTPTPPPGSGDLTQSACPACKAVLLSGAIACMDCGYMLQPDTGAEPEHRPTLCPNPACGVANAPQDRNCQRCGSPLPTAPGTVLHGRYRVERQLAVGGFGAVYLATDLKDGNRLVAIKDMICADAQEFNIRVNFFRREAEILRSLQNLPIVPRVFDFIQQGQTAHLVLEYIRGRDLFQIMEKNGNKPFPLDLVVEWGKSVCDVLAFMHSQSPPLVHRDLKPDNLMLLEDQRHIQMIDFGTARDVGRSKRSRLAAKTRVFTEGYAPPEQIMGKPEPRSDLFALASTMYHLATGKAPGGVATARELAVQLADSAGPIPADYRWLFELIRTNLAEDVNARYCSAKEFKADLEKKQLTLEVECPNCQATNKVREPYCCQCAEALTDPTPPCHHCGQINRMGSRWCIHCGNRLVIGH